MSTTTEILFNSPALHSLKREQLVKLCKIHSIKASGKNVDLIHKLRLHAQTLPKDSPLSIAARSEEHGPIPMQLQSTTNMTNDEKKEEAERDDEEMRCAEDGDESGYQNQSSRPPRPSEQWEMVMDSIEELEEEGSSQGTLTSIHTAGQGGGATGEFGTGGSSSRSTTVSSSIKAIATSLGLKRGNTKSTTVSSTSSFPSINMTKNSAFPSHNNHPVDEAPDDELSQISTPYSSLPESTSLPQTDHFTLTNDTRMSIGGNTEVPLPGTILRPGIPAPPNARLSMGLNGPSTPTRPTTTIRLISNPLSSTTADGERSYDTYPYHGGGGGGAGENGTPQLKPFKTSFDITFGSPVAPLGGGVGSIASAFNFGSLTTWPPRSESDADADDVPMTGLYPTLTFSDLPPSIEPKQPGTPAKPGDVSIHLDNPNNNNNNNGVFVFGTPHKVTDDQFRSAAASVLEDLNRQLREDGIEELGGEIIAKLHPAAAKAKARKESLALREIRPIPGSKSNGNRGVITDKFERMHEEEFEKMEGIDETLRRRNERLLGKQQRQRQRQQDDDDGEKVVVGKKRKSSVIGGVAKEGPRRPSGFAPRRASNTRVISNGRRAKVALPGAFGLDDGEDEDDDDVNANDHNHDNAEEEDEGRGRAGKRLRVDPDSASTSHEEQEREKKRLELERESEAIRKKLEANRARRRSSAVHGGLSARKSGRVSVGRPRPSVLVKPKPKPSRFGFLSSAKSLVQSVWNRNKAPATAAAAGPSQIPKPTGSLTSTSSATATAVASSSSSTKNEPSKGKEKMGPPPPPPMLLSKKQRASIAPARPTHVVASGSGGSRVVPSSSVASGSSSTRSRSPLPPTFTATGTSTATATGTRSRTASSNVSSIGTRLSSNRSSNIGSMGTKHTGPGPSSVASRSSAGASTTTSRLYAPTASSLAKMTRSTGGHQRTGSGSQKSTLGSITNSPTVVNAPSAASSSSAAAAATNPHSPTVSLTMSPTSTLFTPIRRRAQAQAETQGEKRIFSKPLLLPTQSGIPTPVKRRVVDGGDGASGNANTVNLNDTPRAKEDQVQAKPSAFVRTHSLNGRKPRISRSKVIARLASQREAGSSSSSRIGGGASAGTTNTNVNGNRTARPSAMAVTSIAPRKSGGGKNRSSLGAKISSRSRGSGGLGGGGGMGAVAMSAKRRARQSEYARRRSKVGSPSLDLGVGGSGAGGGGGEAVQVSMDMD